VCQRHVVARFFFHFLSWLSVFNSEYAVPCPPLYSLTGHQTSVGIHVDKNLLGLRQIYFCSTTIYNRGWSLVSLSLSRLKATLRSSVLLRAACFGRRQLTGGWEFQHLNGSYEVSQLASQLHNVRLCFCSEASS
jgi:hypothetical protein